MAELEMVDRVASALANSAAIKGGMPPVTNAIQMLPDHIAEFIREQARAAIKAMREPVPAMWAAGGNAVVGYKQRHHDKVVEDVWTGMIDAALQVSA